jgi:hypothetical protein
MQKNHLSKGTRRARPLVAWAEVVGEQMARTTRAVIVRDGVMIVETQDAIAANFLTMQRTLYLDKLREVLGNDAPNDLKFQMGAFDSPKSPRRERAPLPLTRAERERVDELVKDASDDVRPAVRAAAEALSRARAERERRGFIPCPICGTLTDRPEPCGHCRRLMTSAGVQQLRSSLLRDPDVLLNEIDPSELDALEVARYLALKHLEDQFESLLLRVVKPPKSRARRVNTDESVPEVRLVFESFAVKYLALRLRKPVSEVERRDRASLPERVRHVLEAGKPGER